MSSKHLFLGLLSLFLTHAPLAAQEDSLNESGAPPPADSIVLQRDPCFGPCPIYRLRIDARGEVLFQPSLSSDHPSRADTLSHTSFMFLMAEAKRIGFDSFPSKIASDRTFCRYRMTDAPTATTTIFRGDQAIAVEDYLGCLPHLLADGMPRVDGRRLRHLREFEDAIDSVAVSKRWIGEATPDW